MKQTKLQLSSNRTRKLSSSRAKLGKRELPCKSVDLASFPPHAWFWSEHPLALPGILESKLLLDQCNRDTTRVGFSVDD